MAMPGNVLQDIILGVGDEERPSDAIYMCTSVATMLYAFDWDYGARQIKMTTGTPRSWQRIDRLLIGAGKILCPIFDPLKHERLSEYSERMTRVRQSYRGIATDLYLRRVFDERALEAVQAGVFESLERAARSELPERLRNPKVEY